MLESALALTPVSVLGGGAFALLGIALALAALGVLPGTSTRTVWPRVGALGLALLLVSCGLTWLTFDAAWLPLGAPAFGLLAAQAVHDAAAARRLRRPSR